MNPNDFVDLCTFYLLTPSGHSLSSHRFFFLFCFLQLQRELFSLFIKLPVLSLFSFMYIELMLANDIDGRDRHSRVPEALRDDSNVVIVTLLLGYPEGGVPGSGPLFPFDF